MSVSPTASPAGHPGTGSEPGQGPPHGLSFGSAADRYDRLRPRYPAAALRWALGDRPRLVVDLGAGTGILTRILLDLGHQAVPVEPDARMRSRLEQTVPGLATRPGSAESIPLADGSVDAVTAGQAYHWFDPQRAHPEIARVLRPTGVFAPVWNIRDWTVDWVAELSRIVSTSRPPDTTGIHSGWLRDPDFGPYFDRPQRETFRHTVPMTADGLVDLISTRSYYLTATPARRAELEGQVRALAATLPEHFELPYRTVIYRAVRLGTDDTEGQALRS